MKRRAALPKGLSLSDVSDCVTGDEALVVDQFEGFPHRQNAKRTFDSICHRSFRTAATVNSENSGHAEELSYRCFRHGPQRSDDDIDQNHGVVKIFTSTLDMPLNRGPRASKLFDELRFDSRGGKAVDKSQRLGKVA